NLNAQARHKATNSAFVQLRATLGRNDVQPIIMLLDIGGNRPAWNGKTPAVAYGLDWPPFEKSNPNQLNVARVYVYASGYPLRPDWHPDKKLSEVAWVLDFTFEGDISDPQVTQISLKVVDGDGQFKPSVAGSDFAQSAVIAAQYDPMPPPMSE